MNVQPAKSCVQNECATS